MCEAEPYTPCVPPSPPGAQFKLNQAVGVLGSRAAVAAPPGCTSVLDRGSMQFVACTPQLCPYADVLAGANGSQVGGRGSGAYGMNSARVGARVRGLGQGLGLGPGLGGWGRG